MSLWHGMFLLFTFFLFGSVMTCESWKTSQDSLHCIALPGLDLKLPLFASGKKLAALPRLVSMKPSAAYALSRPAYDA